VLQQLNAPVVLLKVLNQDVLQSCNKSSDVPDLRYPCLCKVHQCLVELMCLYLNIWCSIFSRTIWTLDMRRLLKALGAATGISAVSASASCLNSDPQSSLAHTVTLNTVSPRKCYAYINALRVLHKVTKHSPPHLRMLVRFRAHVSTIELETLPLAALTLAA